MGLHNFKEGGDFCRGQRIASGCIDFDWHHLPRLGRQVDLRHGKHSPRLLASPGYRVTIGPYDRLRYCEGGLPRRLTVPVPKPRRRAA